MMGPGAGQLAFAHAHPVRTLASARVPTDGAAQAARERGRLIAHACPPVSDASRSAVPDQVAHTSGTHCRRAHAHCAIPLRRDWSHPTALSRSVGLSRPARAGAGGYTNTEQSAIMAAFRGYTGSGQSAIAATGRSDAAQAATQQSGQYSGYTGTE